MSRECPKVRSLLSEYMDGWLSSSQQRWVEEHLARCAACAEECRSLRATVGLLRSLPALPVPRSFALRVPAVQPRPLFFYLQAATAAVALLVVLLAGSLLMQQAAAPQPREQPAPAALAPTPSSPVPAPAPPPRLEAAPRKAPPPELTPEALRALAGADIATPIGEATPPPSERVAPVEGGDMLLWALFGMLGMLAALSLATAMAWRRRAP